MGGPLLSVFRVALARLPSIVRMLKIWAPLRVPVQPLAVLDASTWDATGELSSGRPGVPLHPRPGHRWWWQSDLGLGDALVLDALRCPHTLFVLPGEGAMDQMRHAMVELYAALPLK